MKTSNKTILVTGGGSGIGFGIAKALDGNGNHLILAGRSEDRLKGAVVQLQDASYIVADVAKEEEVDALVQTIKSRYGKLDILVNNAGTGYVNFPTGGEGFYDKAKYEITLNYLSVLRLTEQLLPLLQANTEAAIVNIESIVSYVPSQVLSTYSATKAALHSYSQSLRFVLQQSAPHVKVFEVFPPFVDTDLTKGFDKPKLSVEEVAQDVINGLATDTYAIRNGDTKDLYQLFRQSPEEALLALNAAETEA